MPEPGDSADAIDEFEELIARALRQLPPEFAARLDSVAIIVADEPTPEQLARTGTRGLLGVYEGVPRTAYGAAGAPVPSKITLFRRPLQTFYPHHAALARAVEDTLFHEIAHHFGISDARLRELARGPRPRGG